MNRGLKLLIKYGCSVIFVALSAWGVLAGADWSQSGEKTLYRILSDAFFIPGALLIFSGLLIWLANEGAFDGVTWVLRNALSRLIPGGRFQRETYPEYVERRREKNVFGYSFLFVVGCISVAVGVVFMLRYMQVN